MHWNFQEIISAKASIIVIMADTKSFPDPAGDPEAKKDVIEEEATMDERTLKLDRQTVLRLDLILMPMTLMLYLLAWLDRANVGNARVVGSFNQLYIQYSANHGNQGWLGKRLEFD